ncbi:hypothetical protein [Nostoc sp.]
MSVRMSNLLRPINLV